MDQRVEEVEAEPDGDDQSEDRFTHRMLLKLAQGERVTTHQRQNRQTERHKCDIEHDRLLAGAAISAWRRKLSIANWKAGRKDLVSFRAAGIQRDLARERHIAERAMPADPIARMETLGAIKTS
jgi:hypothetical protein